ncbi:MAG: thioredoxin family protein [Ruminococcus sp.]|nr:thioredoxin family protein [Ruminococcus sp.]
MPQRVNAEQFAEALGAPVLVADFYSDSCVPCKHLSPVIAELEEKLPEVRFVKINIAYEKELTEKYDVMSAPTLILFKNGVEADRRTGFAPAGEIEEFITK